LQNEQRIKMGSWLAVFPHVDCKFRSDRSKIRTRRKPKAKVLLAEDNTGLTKLSGLGGCGLGRSGSLGLGRLHGPGGGLGWLGLGSGLGGILGLGSLGRLLGFSSSLLGLSGGLGLFGLSGSGGVSGLLLGRGAASVRGIDSGVCLFLLRVGDSSGGVGLSDGHGGDQGDRDSGESDLWETHN